MSDNSENTPKRIQRKRTKGWRMPEGAVYVGRPSQWGNPFTAEDYWKSGYVGHIGIARAWAKAQFRVYVLGRLESGVGYPLAALRGQDLACWCPLDQPCHADVLLEIANA
jgi:hypothetical protein